MRRLRKILSRSTVNQAESKNIFQILLLYLFIAVSMELFFFCVLSLSSLIISVALWTLGTQEICLIQAKFLYKITNFKNNCWRVCASQHNYGSMKE